MQAILERLQEAAESWWSPPTPRERLNKSARDIERALRRLDRQRLECDAREAAALKTLRAKATAGLPLAGVRALARDVARVRSSRDKVFAAQEKLEAMRANLVGSAVTTEVSAVMSAATAALGAVPGVADAARARAEVLAFERAQAGMEMYEDALGGALEDAEGTVQEGEDIADQIMDEVGITLHRAMPDAGAWPSDDKAAGAGAAEIVRRIENLQADADATRKQ